ncbi:restriction endonuclease subunit S [Legionella qingyii]|uniref:restriction endonuclease subunit S n=1 Tax=Legionella qingyii TaxID=2184757 RepID=UPI000F8C39F3|nr:restriction endonuclease subunit S [Legionella qingyii]RUR24675.1 restriction endonuclease subunit S [Legionella qingyii]
MSWPTVKLNEVAEIVTGTTPPKQNPEYYGGKIPFITPSELNDNEISKPAVYLSELGAKKSRILPPSSVLVCCIGSLGKVGFAHNELATNQQINSLIFDQSKIYPRFGYHFCKTLKSTLNHIAPSTTVAIVNKTRFSELKIPLPPLNEQIRIAAILDKADAVRRKRQQAIELSEQLLRSVFLDMFGDPVSNSKGFKLVNISDIGKIITGNTPSRKKEQYYDSEIEWIKSDNINTPFHYLTKAEEYLSKEGKLVGRCAPKNSILITCIAGSKNCIGNIAMTDREVAFNQQINAIIPNEKILLYFLYAQLLFNKGIIQNASTNSMKGMVSKSKLSNIKILLPPIVEQKKYTQFFSKAVKKLQKDNLAYNELDKLFNALTQKAFRGELSKQSETELA